MLITPAGAGIFESVFLRPGSVAVLLYHYSAYACHWHEFEGQSSEPTHLARATHEELQAHSFAQANLRCLLEAGD